MSDDEARFRARAQECRDVAGQARDDDARRLLLEVAEELEHEADKIAGEESGARPRTIE
jgi:hypothetical protein